VRSAMEILRRQHGIADPDAAFDVLRVVSQRHNVKLRAVAAAVVSSTPAHEKRNGTATLPSPTVDFSPHACAHMPNRTAVLQDLMRAAMSETQADYSTVQVRDPIHGGLRLEGNSGFGRDVLTSSDMSTTVVRHVGKRWRTAGKSWSTTSKTRRSSMSPIARWC
jgi:ANTAR domain